MILGKGERVELKIELLKLAHCSKLEKVLDENVTSQFEYFPFIWALVMSKLAIWLNSVGIQGHKGKKSVKKGQIWSFLANFDLVLPLKFWMPTDFNNLAYFGINNVQMNGKCWNRGVTFSSRTIFHFEQCVVDSTHQEQGFSAKYILNLWSVLFYHR